MGGSERTDWLCCGDAIGAKEDRACVLSSVEDESKMGIYSPKFCSCIKDAFLVCVIEYRSSQDNSCADLYCMVLRVPWWCAGGHIHVYCLRDVGHMQVSDYWFECIHDVPKTLFSDCGQSGQHNSCHIFNQLNN